MSGNPILPKSELGSQLVRLRRHTDALLSHLQDGAEVESSMLRTARARQAELMSLLNSLAGTPVPLSPGLAPLERAVADVLQGVENTVSAALTDDMPIEEVEAVMVRNEDALLWLDQARISAMAMFTHMDKALQCTRQDARHG